MSLRKSNFTPLQLMLINPALEGIKSDLINLGSLLELKKDSEILVIVKRIDKAIDSLIFLGVDGSSEVMKEIFGNKFYKSVKENLTS